MQAGTAIAVALMPPVCVIGLSISQAEELLRRGTTLLYLTNLLGITLSCMLVFLIAGYTSLRRGRKALRQTIIFTSLLLIAECGSFVQLVQEAKLEAFVERVLVNCTVTFQDVELISSDVNWVSNLPEVRLNVGVVGTLAPNQVRLLEQFVAKETGQRFTLILQVRQIEEISRGYNEQSPTATK